MMSWMTDSPDFETVSNIIILTLLTSLISCWTLPLVRRPFLVRLDAYRLSREQLRTPLPQNLLDRHGIFQSIRRALEDPDFNTVMLYSPRGAGKTTAIRSVLRQHKGVLAWDITANTYESATSEMKEKWKESIGDRDMNYAEDVCRRIMHKCGRPLIIVVSLEAQANPATLRSVLHFCKMMSSDTQYVRFVVDISASRVILDMRTDLQKLRLSGVLVGPLTLQEVNSFLMNELPTEWADDQKQTISQEIPSKLGCLALVLREICEKFDNGMALEEALNIVQEIHRDKKRQALSRLREFDSRVAEVLGALQDSPRPPSLKNEGGLDNEGLEQLTSYLTFSGFAALIEALGSPYIFDIDPFTYRVTLCGPVVKEAFMEHYP